MKKLITLLALCCLMVTGAWADGPTVYTAGAPIDILSMSNGSSKTVLMYAAGNGNSGFVYVNKDGTERFYINGTKGAATSSDYYEFTLMRNNDGTFTVKSSKPDNKYLAGWPSSSGGAYGPGQLGGNGTYVTSFNAAACTSSTTSLEGGNTYTFTANRTNGVPVQHNGNIFSINNDGAHNVALQFCTFTKMPLVAGKSYSIKSKFSDKTNSHYLCENGSGVTASATFPADNSGYWTYTSDGKFQNLQYTSRYLLGNSGFKSNETGTVFTLKAGLANGTATFYNGSTSYAVNKDGTTNGGQYSQGVKEHNTGDWTTDMVLEESGSITYVPYADGEITYGPLNGDTWSVWSGDVPAGLSALGSTYNATNLKVIEKYYHFEEAGILSATFTYTSGNNRLDIAGVQVLSSAGVQVVADFHVGKAGNPSANNDYTVTIPEGGDYIVRYISTANCGSEQNINTNGKVVNAFIATTPKNYTVHIVNAPTGTKVTYNGEEYGDNGVIENAVVLPRDIVAPSFDDLTLVGVTINGTDIYVTYGDYKVVFDNAHSSVPYRIPAVGQAYNGDLIFVTDYRYSHADIGQVTNGKLDLKYRKKYADGHWGDEKTLQACIDNGSEFIAFGDPCIVCDRESNRVMVTSCCGNIGFTNGTYENHQGWARWYSSDGGETWDATFVDLAPQVVEQLDERQGDKMNAFFIGSGKISQSHIIKKGQYYRLYCASNTRMQSGKCNFVWYSDDFGATWNLLGSPDVKAINGGDEPKADELPDGSVVISSRDSGRIFNIFHYTDYENAEGYWGTQATSSSNNSGCYGTGCNGEILIVPVMKKSNNAKTYLALQSIPADANRNYVSIYWKELTDFTKYRNASELAPNWTKFPVSTTSSAYSTMCQMQNGHIAFFYEENGYNGGYDMIYKNFTVEDITNDAYEFYDLNAAAKATEKAAYLTACVGTYFDEEADEVQALAEAYEAEPTMENYDALNAALQSPDDLFFTPGLYQIQVGSGTGADHENYTNYYLYAKGKSEEWPIGLTTDATDETTYVYIWGSHDNWHMEFNHGTADSYYAANNCKAATSAASLTFTPNDDKTEWKIWGGNQRWMGWKSNGVVFVGSSSTSSPENDNCYFKFTKVEEELPTPALSIETNTTVTSSQLSELSITFTGDNAAQVQLSETKNKAYLTPKTSTPAQVKAQNGKFKAAGETPAAIEGTITKDANTDGKFNIAFEDEIPAGDYELSIPEGTFLVGTTPVPVLKANYKVAEEPAPSVTYTLGDMITSFDEIVSGEYYAIKRVAGGFATFDGSSNKVVCSNAYSTDGTAAFIFTGDNTNGYTIKSAIADLYFPVLELKNASTGASVVLGEDQETYLLVDNNLNQEGIQIKSMNSNNLYLNSGGGDFVGWNNQGGNNTQMYLYKVDVNHPDTPDPVTATYTLTPAAGNVEASDLATITLAFTGDFEDVTWLAEDEMEEYVPILYKNDEEWAGPESMTMNDDGTVSISFDTSDITDGEWTLTIPEGTFTTLVGEAQPVPVAEITAAYTVGSSQEIPVNGKVYTIYNDHSGNAWYVSKTRTTNGRQDITSERVADGSQEWIVWGSETAGYTFYNRNDNSVVLTANEGITLFSIDPQNHTRGVSLCKLNNNYHIAGNSHTGTLNGGKFTDASTNYYNNEYVNGDNRWSTDFVFVPTGEYAYKVITTEGQTVTYNEKTYNKDAFVVSTDKLAANSVTASEITGKTASVSIDNDAMTITVTYTENVDQETPVNGKVYTVYNDHLLVPYYVSSSQNNAAGYQDLTTTKTTDGTQQWIVWGSEGAGYTLYNLADNSIIMKANSGSVFDFTDAHKLTGVSIYKHGSLEKQGGNRTTLTLKDGMFTETSTTQKLFNDEGYEWSTDFVFLPTGQLAYHVEGDEGGQVTVGGTTYSLGQFIITDSQLTSESLTAKTGYKVALTGNVIFVTDNNSVADPSIDQLKTAGTYYVYIQDKATHKYLYNDRANGTETLEGTTSSPGRNNAYIWRITSDGTDFDILNGQGYGYKASADEIEKRHGAIANIPTPWKITLIPESYIWDAKVLYCDAGEGYILHDSNRAYDGGFFASANNDKLGDDLTGGAVEGYKFGDVASDNRNLTTIIRYYTPVEEEDHPYLCQQFAEALDHMFNGDIGYFPIDYYDELLWVAYEEIIGIMLGINPSPDFYREVIEHFNYIAQARPSETVMPEYGDAFKLSVRSNNGRKHYYLKNDGTVTENADEAEIFVMGSTGVDGFATLFASNNNADNRYLQSNGPTAEGYEAGKTDINLRLMVTEDNIDNIQTEPCRRFGTFGFQVKKNAESDETTTATITLDETNKTWKITDAEEPLMKGTFTSAIELTKVEYPYNKPNFTSGNPDEHEGGYASIWLPYPMVFPSNVEVYKGTVENEARDLLILTQVDEESVVAAGGYILRNKNTEETNCLVLPAHAAPEYLVTDDDQVFYGSTEDPVDENNEAKADEDGSMWTAFLAAHANDSEYGVTPYVLANKSKGIGFYKYVGTKLPKGKAIWFSPNDAPKSDCVKFTFEEVISAIEALHGNTDKAEIYDLQGHRLNKVEKGQVNVINGKKVMFK